MKNANRPASPCKTSENTGEPHYQDVPHNGLTKREHFAGLAMQGLLSRGYGKHEDRGYEQRMSNRAVIIADTLLRELEK